MKKFYIPVDKSLINCIVDRSGYDKCKEIKWKFSQHGYIENEDVGFMHRLIMNAPSDYHVHHVNGCKFDNRHSNLLLVTPEEHQKISHGKQASRTNTHYYFRLDDVWYIGQVLESSRLRILDYKLPSQDQAKAIVDHLNNHIKESDYVV